MDKFVTVVKPSTIRATGKDKEKQRPVLKYNPYETTRDNEKKLNNWKDRKRTEKILAPLLKDGDGAKPSSSALTKHLLQTLSDESNPITHSDIYQRSDYVTSAASGHQRSDRRPNQKLYHEARSKKLTEQLPEKPAASKTTVLNNVRIYIDGYLDGTTDIEMKRIVTIAGGRILPTPSGATHILTSQQLSGIKTHRLLTSKSKVKPHVVQPEWVTDSIKTGKRLSERSYLVIENVTAKSLTQMFAAGSSLQDPIELD